MLPAVCAASAYSLYAAFLLSVFVTHSARFWRERFAALLHFIHGGCYFRHAVVAEVERDTCVGARDIVHIYSVAFQREPRVV